MYGPDVVMQPSSLRTIDQVCNHVEGFGMLELGIDDVGDSIVAEIDLRPVKIVKLGNSESSKQHPPCRHLSL